MKFKKSFILSALTVLALCSCGGGEVSSSTSQEDKFDIPIDKSLVYGMTDIYWQEYSWSNISYTEEHKLFEALGVKSIRFWAHATWLLKDPETLDETGYGLARASFEQIKDKGYQIIGLNHGSFKNMYKGEQKYSVASSKPPRDLTEGSKYRQWLDDYEKSWFTVVNNMKEITYWEIDNETNNGAFMPRVGGGQFSKAEMAEITYDMMYFASRGIHRANPNAITVMGGLIVEGIENFLNDIYDLIESNTWGTTNPDDFFQIAAWHPYMQGFGKQRFINMNNNIYKVIRDREGKHKKVFFTEAGFDDNLYNNNEEKMAEYLKEMYDATKNDLPYVETLHYFRMWDEDTATKPTRWGLFTDPTKQREGANPPNRAAPKPAAFAYQEIAGGTGDLHSYENYIIEHGGTL